MSQTEVIFWDVYGTLITAHRGDLDSLLRRELELGMAFERTARNFSLRADPAQLQELFLRGIQAERERRIAEGVAHPEVRVDEIWFKLLEKFQSDEPPTLSLAREHGLSAYDAAYLELALRQGLPLATLDAGLRKAAARAGVELIT